MSEKRQLLLAEIDRRAVRYLDDAPRRQRWARWRPMILGVHEWRHDRDRLREALLEALACGLAWLEEETP